MAVATVYVRVSVSSPASPSESSRGSPYGFVLEPPDDSIR